MGRKKKEAEEKVRIFEAQKKKKEEREAKKLAKMRALGADYMIEERKRKLKKKIKKRRRQRKLSDEEDEDYKASKPKIERKPKKKIPESWAEAEFSKFSSGSDGSGLEDEDEQDIEDMYHANEEETRPKKNQQSRGLAGGEALGFKYSN